MWTMWYWQSNTDWLIKHLLLLLLRKNDGPVVLLLNLWMCIVKSFMYRLCLIDYPTKIIFAFTVPLIVHVSSNDKVIKAIRDYFAKKPNRYFYIQLKLLLKICIRLLFLISTWEYKKGNPSKYLKFILETLCYIHHINFP